MERVLSVMILQERPRAWRRERSRGDGGVDVADPVAGGYEVFQIKSFTGSLTSRRKADIEKSYKSALAGGELDRPITAWHLMLPMDQSKEAEKWFKGLTRNAPFDADWLGRSRVDLLAANNPHVVDYYLRDGRERIERRYRDLLRTRDLIEAADVGPRPAEVSEGLRLLLEALNRDDPHYRYTFEVSHDRPPIEGERSRPGLVMARTECVADRGCVTIRIFARHRHALEERPITISFGVEAESQAHLEVQKALDFGSVVELSDGEITNMEVSAPGGLDSAHDAGGMRISGYAEENFVPFRLRLTLRDAEQELASTSIAVVERRSGNRGKELTCVDGGGAFSFLMRIADPGAGDIDVALASWSMDFWGKSATSVRDGVQVLSALHHPNTLVIALEDGNRHMMTMNLMDKDGLLPPLVASFVADLATIQPHTRTMLLVPLTITANDVRHAREASRLVSGTLIDGEWSEASMVVDAQYVQGFLDRLNTGEGFSAQLPYWLRVGSQEVELGQYILRLASARAVDPSQALREAGAGHSPDAGVSVELVPGAANARFEMLWADDQPKSTE